MNQQIYQCKNCKKQSNSIHDFFVCWQCDYYECTDCGIRRLFHTSDEMVAHTPKPSQIGTCPECKKMWGNAQIPGPTRLEIARHTSMGQMSLMMGARGPTQAQIWMISIEMEDLTQDIGDKLQKITPTIKERKVDEWLKLLDSILDLFHRMMLCGKKIFKYQDNLQKNNLFNPIDQLQQDKTRSETSRAQLGFDILGSILSFFRGIIPFQDFRSKLVTLAAESVQVLSQSQQSGLSNLSTIQPDAQGNYNAVWISEYLDQIFSTYLQNDEHGGHHHAPGERCDHQMHIKDIRITGPDGKEISLKNLIPKPPTISPSDPALQSKESFAHKLGEIFKTQNWELGIALTENWLKNHPEDVEGQGLYAMCFQMAGYFKDAIRINETLLQNPQASRIYDSVHSNLGTCYFLMHNYEKAIENYEKCPKTMPKLPPDLLAIFYSNFGLAYMFLGEPEKGISYLRKARSLGENMKEAIAWIQLYEGFIVPYQKAIVADPEAWTVLNALGWEFLQKDKIFPIPYGMGSFLIKEGQAHRDKKMECFGKDLLASTLIERGLPEDPQRAIALFEEIKAVDPTFLSEEYYQKAFAKLGGQ